MHCSKVTRYKITLSKKFSSLSLLLSHLLLYLGMHLVTFLTIILERFLHKYSVHFTHVLYIFFTQMFAWYKYFSATDFYHDVFWRLSICMHGETSPFFLLTIEYCIVHIYCKLFSKITWLDNPSFNGKPGEF